MGIKRKKVLRTLCTGCVDNRGESDNEVDCACANKLVQIVRVALYKEEGNNRQKCPERIALASRIK